MDTTTWNIYKKCYQIMGELPICEFASVLCVLLETKCLEEDINVVGAAWKIAEAVQEVNTELGEITLAGKEE